LYFLFFYPVGTEAPSGRRPVGTVLLLLVLLALFSLRYLRPDLYLELVNASFRPADPRLLPAFLSLFLHGGWLHLGGNALYLGIFGRALEARLGFGALAWLFAGGGVAACWTQALFTSPDAFNRGAPMIGASGSVAAVLGATLVRFPHVRVRVLWVVFALLGGLNRGGVAHVNTVLACALWFALQFAHGLVAWGNGGSATAYAAHAGGFVVGLLFALALGWQREARREIHRERARRYFERGDWHAAAGELTEHLRHVPEDRDARARRARCWVLLGRSGEAAAEYQRAFRSAAEARVNDELARLVEEMRRYGVGSGLDARELLRLAFDLQKAGRADAAALVYEEITNRFPEGPLAEIALIRRAEIFWGVLGDYAQAQSDYRRLVDSHPASEWRELAEARLRSMRALTGEGSVLTRPRDTSTRPRPSSARPPIAG
jgi:membrane associated rhomboid family serine protease